MRWTVGRGIVAGYAVVLLLLAVVAGMGMYALSRTAGSLASVIREREHGIEAALEARGWRTSISRHPPGLRLVVMPHVSLARAKEFAADLRAVSEKLGLP